IGTNILLLSVEAPYFFTKGQRESVKLNYDGHSFVKFMENGRGTKWICATRSTTKCRARIRTTRKNKLEVLHAAHNHEVIVKDGRRRTRTKVEISSPKKKASSR
ncbi:uncharacterized protein pre-mod(mdg4)-U, partial [Drosophila bipectinata]|uniref:uncharacterized protein pre-mod(mdg4)-U n=1 Tax=Drosophila bipectinata TaxID=42026 RepID=UPI0038B30D0B